MSADQKQKSTLTPAARSALRRKRLLLVTSEAAGFRRLRNGKGFRYIDAQKRPVKKPEVLERIAALRIPPAWNEVWISVKANSHLQATGLDARGRKQYLYHPHWKEIREQEKYRHMLEFVDALPNIRQRVRRDLAKKGLPKEKVLALVVRLLETTLIRVGSEEYAKSNHSYGLSTMRDHHVTIRGKRVTFHFLGKSKKKHKIEMSNEKLAAIVKQCRDVPGQELFQYQAPDGSHHGVNSTDINQYLKEISGLDVTAKDFRTWAGTCHAALALNQLSDCENKTKVKKNIRAAIQTVSERLGNTPAICRSSYIHPFVIDAYSDGSLVEYFSKKTKVKRRIRWSAGLRIEEQTVFTFLKRRRLIGSLNEFKKIKQNADRFLTAS